MLKCSYRDNLFSKPSMSSEISGAEIDTLTAAPVFCLPVVETLSKFACFAQGDVDAVQQALLGQSVLEWLQRALARHQVRAEMLAREALGRATSDEALDDVIERKLSSRLITETIKQRVEYMALTTAAFTAAASGIMPYADAAKALAVALAAESACDVISALSERALTGSSTAALDRSSLLRNSRISPSIPAVRLPLRVDLLD